MSCRAEAPACWQELSLFRFQLIQGGIMESAAEFIFGPLPPIEETATSAANKEPATSAASAVEHLGPLAGLVGTWTGGGFNVIWRPHHGPLTPALEQDHVLELNVTDEQLDFGPVLGDIPNRGLRQRNISLHGLNYLQRIFDANVEHKAQHFEPGLWVLVPETSAPPEPRTVARLACIPHGTTILAQGTAEDLDGAPAIPEVSIHPFVLHDPAQDMGVLKEQNLHKLSPFRIPRRPLLHGITQEMVDDPNSVLRSATGGLHIEKTTRLDVTTHGSLPGGGTSNIAFLKGRPDRQNAATTNVTATFWLQTLAGDSEPSLLQYSQTVVLFFNSFSWPHVTVATLIKNGTTHTPS
jgi:hypothetical protein